MKKTLITFMFTFLCCVFLFLLLFNSKECIALASNGLLIWYRNMIPSLFPFMVLSGFIIRSGLSLKIGRWLQPILGFFFPLPSQMLYAIFMGFLCGFPMGAKMVADMLEKKQITEKEGEYLLAFCNNIGPLYMLGYVIPLFHYKIVWHILGLMYLIPLVYGFILYYAFSLKPTACTCYKEKTISSNYLISFQQSLSSAIEQITMLGGCMVFFNCLLIFPKIAEHFLSHTLNFTNTPFLTGILSCLIEIGGGLQRIALLFNSPITYDKNTPLISLYSLADSNSIHIYLPLALLTFGGLSCITQTCFILKNTGLKISTYIKHKFIQTCIFLILLFIF